MQLRRYAVCSETEHAIRWHYFWTWRNAISHRARWKTFSTLYVWHNGSWTWEKIY